MTRRMTDEEKKAFSDRVKRDIESGKSGLYGRNLEKTIELYFNPNDVIHATPLVCTNPSCRIEMGGILSPKKSVSDMLHEEYLNYLCPACYTKLMKNMGYEK